MCPNCKNKVCVTPPLLSLPLAAHLWHIFGRLGKSIVFGAPEILAMDTSTGCSEGKREAEAEGESRDVQS